MVLRVNANIVNPAVLPCGALFVHFTLSLILGDMHAHVPHAMNKCNCKTNLEINEQGYMAVKLFICIKMCYCSCNWQASYMYVRCL